MIFIIKKIVDCCYKRRFLRSFFLWGSVFYHTGCQIADPNETTQVILYPRPLLDELRIVSNKIELKIRSYVNDSDFSNYNIFLGEVNDALESVENQDIGGFESLDEMDFFLTNTTRPSFSSSGFQTLTHSQRMGLNLNEDYKIGAACFGIQALYARIQRNNGWIQSKISKTLSFNMRAEWSLEVVNYFASSSLGGLRINSSGMVEVFNMGNNPLSSPSPLAFYISSFEGELRLLIISPTSSDGALQDLGYRSDFYQAILPPDLGYQAGEPLVLEEKHLYLIRTAGGYIKIYTEDLIPPVVTSMNENIKINFKVALLLGTRRVLF